MASGTRSKADSDMKQKMAELKEFAATLFDDEAERKEFVRARFEAFEREEEKRKEKEDEKEEKRKEDEKEERRLAREHEIAMERERRETETALKEREARKEAEIAIAKEREVTEREKEITLREKEKEITAREKIAADKENEAARQASSESRPASPASFQSSLNGLPHMPMEHFDDKTENIEVYLVRFEEVARFYGLPEEKWCFRLSQCLRGKAYEVYSKLPSGQREDYTALKQALLVQFELTAEAYHKKFRSSRLERRETYGNLCERLDKYLVRWHALSRLPETFDGLACLVLSEQLLECMSPEVRVYVKEQQATAPADIASAADRYLNARKDLKGKATATDQQTDQPTSPAQSNLAPKTPQHNLAPGRQSAPHSHNNRPNHQSRYNQTNYSQRDSRHSARDSRPTPQRQQQAPRTLSTVTPVSQPSAIDPSDQPEEDTYFVSTMAVVPQPTAIDLGQPELPPVLPHPTSSPPGVENILANGVEVLGLYDSGCSFGAVINRTLIDPSDLTGGTVTIQSIDRGTPPQVLPVARVHVECRYVHGTIDAAVMDTPVYDFILGSKYVPLGVVNKPYFSLPVGRSTKQKRGSNQPVGSPGRHTHPPGPDSSAKLKPLRPGIDSARKSRVKSHTRTREGLLDPGYSAKITQHSSDIDSVRMPRGKMNPCSRGLAPLHGSSATIPNQPLPGIDSVRKSRGKPNPRARQDYSHPGPSATIQYQPFPGINRVRRPRCKPDYRTRGDVLRQNSTFFIRPLFPDIDRVRRYRGKLTTYSREEAPHSGLGGKPQRAHVPWAPRLSPNHPPQSAPGRKYNSSNRPIYSPKQPHVFHSGDYLLRDGK
ncbi:uncharacterized protein LOC129925752 [Biomphalaria glabrata]|uniref:Uncharacterized protein LOC129925752 n=1 Tax=Biomphalaria glabrata TaxID=6526 RepID=A0A9W3A4P6_BIOGL|nr:uncharacterized protein LOC129925752 [Biomphalaria glabrata]